LIILGQLFFSPNDSLIMGQREYYIMLILYICFLKNIKHSLFLLITMNEWSHKAQLIVIRDFTCRDQSLYIRLLISSYREISSYI